MKKLSNLVLPLCLFGAEEIIVEQEILPTLPQPQQEVILEPMPQIYYEIRKNGFLFGVDVMLGEFNTTTYYTPSSFSQSAKGFSGMFGVFGGYQHYFDEFFGIRATIHLSSGTLSDAQYSSDFGNLQNTSTPLWLGMQLSVLWDFLQYGEYALGMSAGIGYNTEFYLNHQYSTPTTIINASTLTQHNLYPILGIHYYFGHHQFEVNYRFSGALNYSSLTNNDGFETKIKYNNYIGFSYALRF